MAPLSSYVSGAWHVPTDEGAPLRDAVTGAEIARISSSGVDFGAALDHGRRVGGPVLRELNFHQRAALLKALAELRGHSDELYDLSLRTGATLGDARFDVDGGIGALFSYASKGAVSCPNDTVVRRGRPGAAQQAAAFVGQHVCTPLPASRCRSTPSTSRSGVRWRSSRRRSWPGCRAGQAGRPDRLPHRAARRADHRVRPAAGGLAAARLRRRR